MVQMMENHTIFLLLVSVSVCTCPMYFTYLGTPVHVAICVNLWGVYKHWTGLLEWWNSGMVDWIFLFSFMIIYDVFSL